MRKRFLCTLLALVMLLALLPVSSRAASMQQEFLAQGAEEYTDESGSRILICEYLYDKNGTLRQKDMFLPQGEPFLTLTYRADGSPEQALHYDASGEHVARITAYDAQGEPAAVYAVQSDGALQQELIYSRSRDEKGLCLHYSIHVCDGRAVETGIYDYTPLMNAQDLPQQRSQCSYLLHRVRYAANGGIDTYDILFYNEQDQLIALHREAEGEAQVSQRTTFLYDSYGNITEEQRTSGEDSSTVQYQYVYDYRGNKIQQLYTAHPETEAPTVIASWEYDTTGRLKRLSTHGASYDFTYLPLSKLQLPKESIPAEMVPGETLPDEQPAAPETPVLPDPDTLFLSEGTEFLTDHGNTSPVKCRYFYDTRGALRRKEETWPSGLPQYIYEYREDGTLLRKLCRSEEGTETLAAEYDIHGYPLYEYIHSGGKAEVSAHYVNTCDDQGRIIQWSKFAPARGLVSSAVYTYREDGSFEVHNFRYTSDPTISHHSVAHRDRWGNRLCAYTDRDGGERICRYYDAEYDDQGNITREMLNWTDILPKEENTLIPYYIYENCYDDSGRLTQINRYQTDCYYEDGREQFSEPISQGRTYFLYDARGNLVEERHGEKTASTDDSIVVYTWEYDDQGNMIRYTDTISSYDYIYLPLSQLLIED